MTAICSCRRRWLGFAALSVLGAPAPLTACGDRQAGGASLSPVEFSATTACELDGMLLADYPGPKAQVHFAGTSAPVFLCDTVEMFSMLLQPEQVRKVVAAFVQDMGQADWDQPRSHWTDATRALDVHGSKRMGSMGPTFASFALEADAAKFVAAYGGRLLRYAEVMPEMVDLGGGAKADTRM